MHRSLYLIHCLSALHIGSGEETGSVDLPIMRLRPYDLPFIPGSALKGCWRAHARLQEGITGTEFTNRQTRIEYFGPDRNGANDHGGALHFNSGQLLCLPVRSFYGTFAWVTCPMQLELLVRHAAVFNAGLALPKVPGIAGSSDEKYQALLPKTRSTDDKDSGSALIRQPNQILLLEDLDLALGPHCEEVNEWAEQIANWVFPKASPITQRWHKLFTERFCVIENAAFEFFASATMDVRFRNSIDEQSGAVRNGMLCTEEHVPAETIFWGGMAVETHAFCSQGNRTKKLNLDPFKSPATLQLGGNATLGQGQIQWYMHDPAVEAGKTTSHER